MLRRQLLDDKDRGGQCPLLSGTRKPGGIYPLCCGHVDRLLPISFHLHVLVVFFRYPSGYLEVEQVNRRLQLRGQKTILEVCVVCHARLAVTHDGRDMLLGGIGLR